MALFNKKTVAKDEVAPGKKKSKIAKIPKMAVAKAVVRVGLPGIGVQFTLRPRITEKASLLAEGNVYTFEVPQNATKGEVRVAIKTLFKVTPIKVAIVRTVGKVKMSRGKKGQKPSIKKAYVYLKKGDKIDFV